MKKTTVIFSIFLLALTACGSKDKKSAEQDTKAKNEMEKSKEDLAEKEKKNPELLLTVSSHDKRNLIGQTVVKGTLTNTAKVSTFKDVDLELTFYSKTGTLLEKDHEVVYETFAPGDSKSFKTKYFAPKGTDSVVLKVMGAKTD